MSALVSPRGLASPSLSARLSNACVERDRETLGVTWTLAWTPRDQLIPTGANNCFYTDVNKSLFCHVIGEITASFFACNVHFCI